MNEMARFHATVEGDVQGVGFRAYVMRRGLTFRLTGWTRNLPDGSVEVVAEGQREHLQLLLDALYAGPLGSTVDRVEFQWEPATGELNFFSIR
jgi:acylphosphatase